MSDDKKIYGQECVLYDRECIGCMECEVCDLDPDKICDNCGKCLDIKEFAAIKIDGIVGLDEEDGRNR
ncbi:MAG TPA: hypothetical protein IAB42_02000 [Candidatus Coproplasma avistercoris]|nr:hypothetical protein [Candidatus Coproplasma avistercoris]